MEQDDKFQFIVFARNMSGGIYTTNPPEMKDFFSSSLSLRSIAPAFFMRRGLFHKQDTG